MKKVIVAVPMLLVISLVVFGLLQMYRMEQIGHRLALEEATTQDRVLTEAEWESAYTKQADLFTTRTYECISEMYSLAYTPVDNGPMCQQACDQLHKVNAMVDSAPSYIENPRQYYLGDASFCHSKKGIKK